MPGKSPWAIARCWTARSASTWNCACRSICAGRIKWRLAAMAGKVFPTKKPDLDNCAKMLDALNLVVWTDDAQIVDMHVRKVYHENPSFIATIWPKFEGVFA